MTESSSAQNSFNISNSSIENLAGSGSIYYNSPSTEPPATSAEKVILFLAANPISTQQLRLDEEVREIEAGLQRAKQRDRFTLKQQWAVRPRDLQRAILELKPQIVHFSGHGVGNSGASAQESSTRKLVPLNSAGEEVGEAGLFLEDQTGRAKLMSTEALAGLFELFKEHVECVVLNACYSERQADAIAQHIPYVIGMDRAISDRAAIEFAIGFYDALGAGQSIEFAYKLGCTAIQMAGIPEHITPVMITRLDA
ncbi:MAG: CHAT domain-containing protein [Myxacorys chilensis ATA2-1-KO14]|jgi:CHAT domain-containing protein|nr:CHAT domain-containing protein [Myxacorys chilensis ATA2-1-KO14]